MMTIDEIEDIMDDTKDAIEHQRQIDELISGQFAGQDIEEEIEDELEALMTMGLPEVPADELSVIKEARKKGKLYSMSKPDRSFLF